MKKQAIMIVLAVAALVLCMVGCGAQEATIPPNETVYKYAAVVSSAEELAALDQYPNLYEVNVSGSDCYSDILAYDEAHPYITVIYDVLLGQERYPMDTVEITLEDGSYELDAVIENLAFLPKVQTINLPKSTLSAEDIAALQEAAPDALISYSVMMFGQELPSDTETLDLSTNTPAQLEEIKAAMALLPKLATVELMDGATTNYSMEDVKALMEAAPNATFSYAFTLFEQEFTTESESMEFLKIRIGDDGAQQLRNALDIMPKCTYLSVDRCGVSTETMASIREDYPNVKVAWRIFFGKFSCMTDEEVLRLTNGLKDEHIDQLRYCNDAVYLDIGHNEELTDVSFIQYMPKLELLILSGSIVEDISVFKDHQNIEFMELCYCPKIKDISFLNTCPNLKYVNISFTAVKDISSLDDLPIGRLVALGCGIPSEDQARFLELHPDALYRFEGEQCYGYAWRYDDYGYTFSDYYKNMREVFNYDDVGYYTGQGIYDTGY